MNAEPPVGTGHGPGMPDVGGAAGLASQAYQTMLEVRAGTSSDQVIVRSGEAHKGATTRVLSWRRRSAG